MADDSVVRDAPQDTAAIAGWTLVLGVALIALTLGGFALVAFGIADGWFQQLDRRVLDGAYSLRAEGGWLYGLMAICTTIGFISGYIIQTSIVAAVVALLRPQRWRSSLVLLLVGGIGGGVLNYFIKEAFARPRPSLYTSDFQLQSYSFPSGHAMSAAILYGSIALVWSRSRGRHRDHWLIGLACVVPTILIGLSRIYFSVHYATDVLGGYLGGLAWLAALALAERALEARRQRLSAEAPGPREI